MSTLTNLLTSKSIHEGGERSSEHLEEGVSDRVSLGPAERRVFQDVGNTSAVHWCCAETNTASEGEVHWHK